MNANEFKNWIDEQKQILEEDLERIMVDTKNSRIQRRIDDLILLIPLYELGLDALNGCTWPQQTYEFAQHIELRGVEFIEFVKEQNK